MRKRKPAALLGAGAVAVLVSAVATAAIADIKRYTVGIAGGYETKRLLSVGDTVPETSNRSKQFKMVGIPDGLGAHRNPNGTKTVFMSHELTATAVSEPVIGDPREPRRARRNSAYAVSSALGAPALRAARPHDLE